MTVKSRLTKAEARLDALSAPATGGIPFDLEKWREAHKDWRLSYEREAELLRKHPGKAAVLHERFAAYRRKLFDRDAAKALTAHPERASELREWHNVRRERLASVEQLGPGWMMDGETSGGVQWQGH